METFEDEFRNMILICSTKKHDLYLSPLTTICGDRGNPQEGVIVKVITHKKDGHLAYSEYVVMKYLDRDGLNIKKMCSKYLNAAEENFITGYLKDIGGILLYLARNEGELQSIFGNVQMHPFWQDSEKITNEWDKIMCFGKYMFWFDKVTKDDITFNISNVETEGISGCNKYGITDIGNIICEDNGAIAEEDKDAMGKIIYTLRNTISWFYKCRNVWMSSTDRLFSGMLKKHNNYGVIWGSRGIIMEVSGGQLGKLTATFC